MGTPQDDDDQASESEQAEHGAIIAAVCGQLAQHDLDQRPDHLDPIATPDRWLTSAATNRAQRHRTEIDAAIACGVTAPAELVEAILAEDARPPVSAPAAQARPTPPQVEAQRRIAQANDDRHAAMLAAPSSPLSPTTQASITDIRSKLR